MGELFANHICNWKLMWKYIKNSYISTGRQVTQLKNWQGASLNIFPKKIEKWLIGTLKKKGSMQLVIQFSSVQSLSRVQLSVTPWIAARQASMSSTNSQSSLRLTSIESVMPSSHLILCCPLLLLPPIPPRISLFQWVNSLHEVTKVLEFQL